KLLKRRSKKVDNETRKNAGEIILITIKFLKRPLNTLVKNNHKNCFDINFKVFLVTFKAHLLADVCLITFCSLYDFIVQNMLFCFKFITIPVGTKVLFNDDITLKILSSSNISKFFLKLK